VGKTEQTATAQLVFIVEPEILNVRIRPRNAPPPQSSCSCTPAPADAQLSPHYRPELDSGFWILLHLASFIRSTYLKLGAELTELQ